ncbi:hypothetical protein, partial [Enterobacter hormaechei]
TLSVSNLKRLSTWVPFTGAWFLGLGIKLTAIFSNKNRLGILFMGGSLKAGHGRCVLRLGKYYKKKMNKNIKIKKKSPSQQKN